jgi:hypothetical protein
MATHYQKIQVTAYFATAILLIAFSFAYPSAIKQAGQEGLMADFSTTSLTYTPTQGSLGMVHIEKADFDGTVSIYLEMVVGLPFSGSPDGMSQGYGQLYDVTNSGAVTGSETWMYAVADYYLWTSDDFSSYFDTHDDIDAYLQVRAANDLTTVNLRAWRVVYKQNGTISKTVTYIPLGSNQTIASQTYADLTYPKWWTYTSTNYDGSVSTYFCATITDNGSADTMFAELYNKTDGSAVSNSILSTTSDVEVYLTSPALTLTTAKTYTCYIRRGATGTGILRNAFLKIVQTGMSSTTGKFQTVMQHTCARWTRAGGYVSQTYQGRYNPADWSNATIDFKGEYIIHRTGGTIFPTAYAHITDDMNEISGSEKSTSNTGYTLLTSGSLTAPNASSKIDDGIKSSQGTTADISCGRTILTITNLGTVAEGLTGAQVIIVNQ